MLMLHEKINWNEYKNYEEKEIYRLISELGDYLNHYHCRNFTYDYYYSLLYMELSEIIFVNYILAHGLIENQGCEDSYELISRLIKKNFKASNSNNLRENIKQLDVGKNEIASLLFFHRHDLFEEFFKQEIDFMNLKKPENYIEHWDECVYKSVIEIFGFDYISNLLRENTVLSTLCGDTLQKGMDELYFPDILLTNSHGLYHNTAMSFYIANMSLREKRVVINQPGFIVPHLQHINQYEYEKSICYKYLGWSKLPSDMHYSKFIPFGSFYASRKTDQKYINATLIVLPQAPSRLRPFSMYYGDYTVATEYYLVDLLKQIKRNINKFPNRIILRCKSVDRPMYQSIMDKIGLDVYLESANVNNPQEQYTNYETIITTYTSTSIIESIGKANRVYFVISERNAKLREEFKKEFLMLGNYYETFDDFEFIDYDASALQSFKQLYGSAIEYEESNIKLKTVLNKI